MEEDSDKKGLCISFYDDGEEMGKTLIIKDDYNSFEQYYLDKLNSFDENVLARHYYISDNYLRKAFTHYGLPFESIWYGEWKKHIKEYELIIVFDSIHTPNLIRYLHKEKAKRIVFWHWNPISTEKDVQMLESTQAICEHWTFNDTDVQKYGMKYNNQFFFYQPNTLSEKKDSVFFVGKDKGRYSCILEIARIIQKQGLEADFHVIASAGKEYRNKAFLQKRYLEYNDVLESIKQSKAVLEITQEGQTGITTRSLEAMFMRTKLITTNRNVVNYSFYNKENVFLLGQDDYCKLSEFLKKPFIELEDKKIEQYSASGWLRSMLQK